MKISIPNMGSPADKIHSYTGSSWTGTVNVSQAAYQFASAFPTQVWKLYADPTQTLSEYPRYVGSKEYELKDHLGNVHVVISDTKLMEDIGSSSNQVDNNDNFIPEVLVYQDYYPFGFGLVGRKYTANGEYRYGFNGKENDAETGTQDYGLRIYDTRIAKFLSVDPLALDYPYKTPYDFAENDVIRSIDLDGGEKNVVVGRLSSYIICDDPQHPGQVMLRLLTVPKYTKVKAEDRDWEVARQVIRALGYPENGSAYIKWNDNGKSTLEYWFHYEGEQYYAKVDDLQGYIDFLDALNAKFEKEIVNACNELVSMYFMFEPIFLMPEGEGGVRTDIKTGFLQAESKMPIISKVPEYLFIIDENLPGQQKLAEALSKEGFRAIFLGQGEQDAEIIELMTKYESAGNKITIVTNNEKDFIGKVNSIVKVSEKLKQNPKKLVEQMKKLSENVKSGKTDMKGKISLTNE